MKCAVPGCPQAQTTRDTCWAHYLHGRRHAQPESCAACAVYANWRPKAFVPDTCKQPGCGRRYFARDMCQMHYRAARRARGLDIWVPS